MPETLSQTGNLRVRSKGQTLNFNYKVNFKDIIPNIECVLKNKIYSTKKVKEIVFAGL